jgi:hypothetical protein
MPARGLLALAVIIIMIIALINSALSPSKDAKSEALQQAQQACAMNPIYISGQVGKLNARLATLDELLSRAFDDSADVSAQAASLDGSWTMLASSTADLRTLLEQNAANPRKASDADQEQYIILGNTVIRQCRSASLTGGRVGS